MSIVTFFTISTDAVVLLFTTDCGDRWLDNQSCVVYIYCLWPSVVTWGAYLHCQKSEKKIFFSYLFVFYVTFESKWLANVPKFFLRPIVAQLDGWRRLESEPNLVISAKTANSRLLAEFEGLTTPHWPCGRFWSFLVLFMCLIKQCFQCLCDVYKMCITVIWRYECQRCGNNTTTTQRHQTTTCIIILCLLISFIAINAIKYHNKDKHCTHPT